MKTVVKFVLLSTLLTIAFGCSANSSEAAAEDARLQAAKGQRAKTVIPSGTLLKVSLIDSLSSDTSLAGDRFQASILQSVVINGATLLPAGTKVRGRVVNAQGAGKVKGRGAISLELTDIVGNNGEMLPISTQRFDAEADDSHGRDAGVIAGGAGVGAVIGAVIGGKKGAAIGAATGGAGGTGVVLATKGKEIQYGPETLLDFTLANSVQL